MAYFRKALVLTTLLLCLSSISFATKKRILFIGNSYIYVNDLPTTLYNLALSLGDTLEFDSNTIGGSTLNYHSTDAVSQAKIKQGNWDYIVLQEQSQMPAFDPSQVATDTYPYAKKLCDTIHAYNPCGEVLFYMTWGRKNGDASNCAAYPPICTYTGMQQRLRESYVEMADSNHASVSPVGVAWKTCRTSNPLIELYQSDESHPSVFGTYLIANTFYSTIFHQSSVGASFISSGISSADATTLQTIASNTVLDSLENWQHAGQIPRAIFSHVHTNGNYTFSNSSLRYTISDWDFGDGSAHSSATSPTHTYTSTGTYIIHLKVSNGICKSDVKTDTIQVNVGPSEIVTVYENATSISYANNNIILQNLHHLDCLKIYSITGAMLGTYSLQKGLNQIPIHLPKGIYVYQLFANKVSVENGKLLL